MNKIEIQGINIEVTRAIEGYAQKKVSKASKNSTENISSIRVNLSCEQRTGTNCVELIVFLQGGKTIRNQTRSEDMYASIDIASASIERQLRKFKEKNMDVKRSRSLEEKN